MKKKPWQRTLDALDSKRARAVLAALFLLAVAAASFSYGWQRVLVLDYNSVDGDFQSYNVFRRILAGQKPYADFANYIGMAPVVLNLPFLLFDGSFVASLFVTNFTCNFLFSLTVFLVFWLVTENAVASMLAGVFFSKVVSSGLVSRLLGPGFGQDLTNLFTNLYTPSNSMRIARLFWPFLLVLVWVLAKRVYAAKTGRQLTVAGAVGSLPFCGLWGFAAGLGVTWSNDFGLAVAFATLLLGGLLLARGAKAVECTPSAPAAHFFPRFGLLCGGLALGFLLSITIATGGRPMAWLDFTAGVGGAQYYYFQGAGGKALLVYIFTNVRLMAFTLPVLAFLGYCLWRLIKNTLTDRLFLLGFLGLNILLGTYAYIISGSGYNFTEALEGYVYIGTLAVLAKGVLWLLKRHGRAVAAICAVLLAVGAAAFGALALRDAAARQTQARPGVYVEALGGYSTYQKALEDAADWTAGGEVFSVYATGLEVVKGQFQPSGYDYIIHALGPAAQAAYVADFTEGQYPWLQTVRFGLEDWLVVQNWYFYREALASYEKQWQTEYSEIWARTEADLRPQADCALSLEQLADGRWQVRVEAAGGEDFIADVEISYKVEHTSPLGAFLCLGRKGAQVFCPDIRGEGHSAGAGLPAESGAYYIPVAVRDGVGAATLEAYDPNWMTLEVYSAKVAGLLPAVEAAEGA